MTRSRVNDPKIKKWLGQVVGKEGEDLSRHDKWLCMMYPRLKLLHRLLADDGVIFVSIDNNEQASLKLMMEEIFGAANFVGTLIWDLPRGINAGHIARSHEYVLTFAKHKNSLSLFNRSPGQQIESVERCNKKVDARHPASVINFKAGVRYEGIDQKLTGKIAGNEWVEIIGELEFKDGKLAKDVSLRAGWTMKDMIADWFLGKEVFDLKGQKIEEFFFKKKRKTLFSKTTCYAVGQICHERFTRYSNWKR
jgi:adenine-specific DNA-methyltransferase